VLRIYFRYYRSKYSVFSYCIRSCSAVFRKQEYYYLSVRIYCSIKALVRIRVNYYVSRFYLYYLKYIRVIAVYKVTVAIPWMVYR